MGERGGRVDKGILASEKIISEHEQWRSVERFLLWCQPKKKGREIAW
jgi:hypothetical protein